MARWQDAPVVEDTVESNGRSARWQDAPIEDDEPGFSDYMASLGRGAGMGVLGVGDLLTSPLRFLMENPPPTPIDMIIGDPPYMQKIPTLTESFSPYLPQAVDDTGGRMLERIGEEIGSYAVPGFGMGAAALRPVQKASSALGRAGQALLEPYRTAPKATALAELSMATGGGVGAGIAQEVAPDSVGAEILGQTVGSIIPAFSPLNIGSRAIGAGKEALSSERASRRATEQAARALGDEIGPDSVVRLNRAEELRQTIPGFDPTLAEATGSTGLARTQMDIEGAAQGQELANMIARREASESALSRYAEQVAPQGYGGADFAVDQSLQNLSRVRGDVQSGVNDITVKRQQVADIPVVDRFATGQSIREGVNTARAQTKQQMNDLANSLGINDSDVTMPFSKAAREIVKEFEPTGLFKGLKESPDDIISELRSVGWPINEQKTVTFSDLKDLREVIGDRLRDATSGAKPNAAQARSLALMRERIDGVIDDLAKSGDPELAQRYQQFRDSYFNDYIRVFETGAPAKVRQKDARGFYTIPEERVAGAFYKPGNVTAARQFKEVFKNTPEAVANMEAVILDDLRNSAVRDGVINSTAFKKWLRKNDSVLNEFPEIRKSVQARAAADESLLVRQMELDGRLARLQDESLTRALDSYGRGSRTADQIISASLKDPRQMRQLKVSIGKNSDAYEALRRELWDRAVSSGDIGGFINGNRKSLEVVLDKNHFKNLENLADALGMMGNVPRPKGAAFDPNPLKEVETAIGIRLPMLANRLRELHTGRSEKAYTITNLATNILRNRGASKSQELLKAALYDPEVAKDLMDMAKGGIGKKDPEKIATKIIRMLHFDKALVERATATATTLQQEE